MHSVEFTPFTAASIISDSLYFLYQKVTEAFMIEIVFEIPGRPKYPRVQRIDKLKKFLIIMPSRPTVLARLYPRIS